MNNRLRGITSKIWLFFLDLIFPIECLGCGREGEWLCPECFRAVRLKSRQYCLHCKKENVYGEFCPPCGITYSLDGVWIAALYDDEPVGRAIKGLKYNFISGLAEPLSELLVKFTDNLLRQAAIVKSGLLAAGLERRRFEQARNSPAALLTFRRNLIIPVPLSKKRRRRRGFNQAELLARTVADYYGLELDFKNLIRVRHKKAQAKLNEISRLENVKDCFSWRGENLDGKNVVLIDDVVTTGATLNECAKVLKAAGAGEVWGLVAAKG